jgi:hypothetical protein
MRPALLEFLDYREKMAHRARQAVEPDDDQDIGDANLAHQAGEHRPGPRGAGSMLLVQDLAACRPELADLSVRRLLLGRDAGIADQASDRSGRVAMGFPAAIQSPLYNIDRLRERILCRRVLSIVS